MVSYLSVGGVSRNYVRDEVELIPYEESKPEDFETKPTEMMDVRRDLFEEAGFFPQEGEIYVVEHDGKDVSIVLFEDTEERERRMAI